MVLKLVDKDAVNEDLIRLEGGPAAPRAGWVSAQVHTSFMLTCIARDYF